MLLGCGGGLCGPSRRDGDGRGYEGGSLERPSYKDVCTDQTGHAKVVEVDFDPEQISFTQLPGPILGVRRGGRQEWDSTNPHSHERYGRFW
ncbi:MAG: peptide-methionine (S)-S-oxide reductase [Terracidiphilus sp.]